MECKQMQDQQSQSMMSNDDEISLIDIFKVLYKRKIFILLVTLVCTFVALGVSLLLPRVYEVVAIVSPATRPVTDDKGQVIEEHQIATPLSMKEAIQNGAYQQEIIKKLQIKEMDFPMIVASVPKETNLLKMAIKTDKPEIAVAVENELIGLIASEQDLKLQVELQQIDQQLTLHSINKENILANLNLYLRQLKESKEKIEALSNARKNKMTNADNAVAVLLYSNEIQANQLYLNDLEVKIQQLNAQLATHNTVRDKLMLKKSLVKNLEVVKVPTIPQKPVSPKKSLITVLGFLLGLIGSIVTAFLLEFLQNAKASGEFN
jgi:LPS O-antigen subunit length determinant protein (WzzB/FepE family)